VETFPYDWFDRMLDVVSLSLPERIHSSYAVCVSLAERPPEPKGIAAAWFETALSREQRERYAAYLHSSRVRVSVRPREAVPLPGTALEAGQAGAEERRRALTASHVLLVNAETDPLAPSLAAVGSLATAQGLSAMLDGVVLAMDLPRLLPITKRADPFMPGGLSVSAFLTCPRSEGRRGLWITTLGMQRFGLPNLELVDVPPSFGELAVPLLLSAAQRLLETVEERGARSAEIARQLTIDAAILARAFAKPALSMGSTRITLRHPHRPRTRLARLLGGLRKPSDAQSPASVESLLRIEPPPGEELGHFYARALSELTIAGGLLRANQPY
jgi:hypothetical protein